MAPPPLRRWLLTVLAACGFALFIPSARAQLYEFTGAELRGRIDRPGLENIWTFGDTNGNGALDSDEQFGTRIDVNDAFLNSPGRARAIFPPAIGLYDFRDDGEALVTAAGPQDNLNGGATGAVVEVPVRDDTGNGGLATNVRDFDDYVFFASAAPFSSIATNTYTQFGGAQLMQVLRFEGEPESTLTRAHETLDLGFGARFLTNPQYSQMSLGGVLAAGAINSNVDNQALGPQLSARWSVRQGRWHARAEAAAALTYMNIEGDQSGQLGANLLPGGLNQPAVLSPTLINNQLSEWDIAPTLEAGLLASYDLTPSSLVFVRADAIQFGNIRGVEQAVVWRLPTMGLRDPGGRDVTITAATIGLELRR
jgi:hypothetical protein